MVWQTATTRIPAAFAAATPVGVSSTARHLDGSTPSRRAASRYPSGAGFIRGTSSQHTTAASASSTRFGVSGMLADVERQLHSVCTAKR